MDQPAAAPFQTLAEFQEAHEQLLDRFEAGAPDGAGGPDGPDAQQERARLIALMEPLQQFLRRGAQGGAYLHEAKERRSAQGLLDYWASLCYGANLDVPRPLLAAHDPALLPELPESACPYVGLEAFEERDARHFFGREERVDALLQRLREARLVVVTGASGSGKSSLVLAGLLPALRAGALEGSAGWLYLPPLVPGAAPLEHLAQALAGALLPPEDPGRDWQAEQVARLRSEPAALAALLGADGRPAVVVVDQFEEAMTLRTEANAPDFAAFVAALQSLVEAAAPPHRLLLTMRSDVDTRLAREYPELNRHYSSAAFPLASMDSRQLRQAIEAPAQQAGLKFQEGVVDELIRSVVGEDAGLPLLQFSLMALWERRRGNLVTLEAQREVGSPRQAMTMAAARLYAELPREQQLAAERLFLALSRQGDGATVFRNRATRRQLHEVAEPVTADRVIEKFERARLLRVTHPHPAEPLDDLVEVAHEALLRSWDLLQRLFAERRDERERRAFLRKQAQKWREAEFNPAFLLGGLALQQATEELAREAMGPLEKDFIDKSVEAEQAAERRQAEEAAQREQFLQDQAELAREREHAAYRAARRLRRASVLAVLVLLATTGLAWWGWHQAELAASKHLAQAELDKRALLRRAEEEKDALVRQAREDAREIADKAQKAADATRERARQATEQAERSLRRAAAQQAALRQELSSAEAGRLATDAAASARSDADLSLLYAAEALRRDPRLMGRVVPAVLEALRYRRAEQRLAPEQIGPVDALALDAAGERLLLANGRELGEWQVGGAERPRRLRQRAWPTAPGDVNFASYVPGSALAAIGTDRGVWLWAEGAEAVPRVLAPEPAPAIERLSVSADGRGLAAVVAGGKRLLAWSLPEGRLLLDHRLQDPQRPLYTAVFSEQGERLIGVSAPDEKDLSSRVLVFDRAGEGFAAPPRALVTPPCELSRMSYATGGPRVGVALAPQLCLQDLRRLGEREAATFSESETELVDDIIFSRDGRHVVKLIRRSGEAQVLDFTSGATTRLQGAFDLPPSNWYEEVLSISGNGERLAIKGADGSVLLFGLAGGKRLLADGRNVVWISPDDRVVVSSAGAGAEAGFEARDPRSGALLRRLGSLAPFRPYTEMSDFVLDPDGRHLHARANCGPPGRRAEDAPRCIVSLDLLAPATPPHEQPYERLLARADSLYLLQDGGQWMVYSATAQRPVLRLDAPAGRLPQGLDIELGHARLFALQRVADEQLRVELYAVEGGEARLLRRHERPLREGWSAGLRGRGRALLLSSPQRSELWDLRTPSAPAPALVLEGGTVGEMLINPDSGLVALRSGSAQPWRLLDLSGARPPAELPAGFRIDAGATHAWAVRDGGWQLRALAAPEQVRLAGEGKPAQLQFGRGGEVVAVWLPEEDRLRVYRLPGGRLVLDTELGQLRRNSLSGGGGYLRDREGRLLPADAQELLTRAQQGMRRFDAAERCRLLRDAEACRLAAPPPTRRASSTSPSP